MANGNTAGGVGAALEAFSRIFGVGLLQNINNKAAAKRQADFQNRQALQRGTLEMISENSLQFFDQSTGLPDPAKVETLAKGLGAGPDTKKSVGLWLLAGGAKQLQEQAALQQEQARKHALQQQAMNFTVGSGPLVPTKSAATPQAAAPITSTLDPANRSIASTTPPDLSPRIAANGDVVNEFGEFAETAADPASDLTGTFSPALENNLVGELQRAGKKVSINIDGITSSRTPAQTAANIANLQQRAIDEGASPLAVFQRSKQLAQTHGVAIPDNPTLREQAFDDGFSQGFQRQSDLMATGQINKFNFRQILDDLRPTGVSLTADDENKHTRPYAQQMFVEHLNRLSVTDAKQLSRMDEIAARAKKENRSLLPTEQAAILEAQSLLSLAPDHRAFELTRAQTGGIGFFAADFPEASKLPNTEDALVEAQTRVGGHNIQGAQFALQQQQNRNAEQVRLNALAGTAAERQDTARNLIPSSQSFARNLTKARDIFKKEAGGSLFGLAKSTLNNFFGISEAEGLFDLAETELTAIKTAFAKAGGQTGNPTELEQEFGIAVFPGRFEVFKDELRTNLTGTDISFFDLRLSVMAGQLTRLNGGRRVELGGIGPELATRVEKSGVLQNNTFMDDIKAAP